MPRFVNFRLWLRALRRFVHDESGMTLPLLGLSMVALTSLSGMAIDGARMEMAQSKLQSSLDAAGLAGGSTVNTANLNTEVSKYLNANFNGYLGATITGTSSTANSNNSVITVSATATLPATFLQIVGIKTITVTANSQITRAASGLELVMVLDNTGSMTDDGKLTSLKSAATSLVNILTGGQTSVPNLWMGLVPFSQAVNIGTGYTSWIDTSTNYNWGPTTWGGCVDARVVKNPAVQLVPGNSSTIDMDITDDPPSVQKFKQFYYAPNNSTPTTNCWAYTQTKSGRTTVKTCTSSGSGLTYASPLNTTTQGPNTYCPQQVTPMTANATTIINAINTMTAQGDTHIDLGLAWGWRMLSPRWRTLWGGEMNANNLPLNYNTQGMNKAVVLLTDGFNTVGSQSGSGGTSIDYTAYHYLENDMLGTTNATTAKTQLDERMTQVCNSLKANGVYVYTIALSTSSDPIDANTEALLQSCATAPNYAFVSPTASQLQTIFSQIGDSLSNLRVSK
jgi:Flp pilus assembly protein TadG